MDSDRYFGFVGDRCGVKGVVSIIDIHWLRERSCGDLVVINEGGGDVGGVGAGVEKSINVVRVAKSISNCDLDGGEGARDLSWSFEKDLICNGRQLLLKRGEKRLNSTVNF